MKRSEALAILSRDHHQSLFIAQRLRRATGDSAVEVRDQLSRYWSEGGHRHFQLEEELMLPAYAAYGDAHHPLVLQVLGDHVAIREQMGRLLDDPEPAPAALQELGVALAAHVRLEERELFGLIEQAMPGEKLLALAHELERAAAMGATP